MSTTQTERQINYNKTPKGIAYLQKQKEIARKKITEHQLKILNKLAKGGYVVKEFSSKKPPFGWHCNLYNSKGRLLIKSISVNIIELLCSDKDKGKLLKIQREKETETVYIISDEGREKINRISKKIEKVRRRKK